MWITWEGRGGRKPGASPWDPVSEEDLQEAISLLRLLRARQPGVVGLDGHDSGDGTIDLFREAFGPAYRDVEVGTWIRVGEGAS